MIKQFEFRGKGGELFVIFFFGILLTLVTIGIYSPWFIVKLNRYLYEKTTLKTDRGNVRFRFTGEGGKLFEIMFFGFLLTVITLGFFGPWFVVNVLKYFWKNSHGRTEDGRGYKLRFNGSGGVLFQVLLVGFLFSLITLGLYMPWFICKIYRFYIMNTTIHSGSKQVGKIDFQGSGREVFGTWLLGFILSVITFAIYLAWFEVNLLKYFFSKTEVTIDDEKYVGGFTGTGGSLFVIYLLGTILQEITLGIYSAWYFRDLHKFQMENTIFQESP